MAERRGESTPDQPPSALAGLLQKRWARVAFLLLTLVLVFVFVSALLLILRFTADRPVEYSDVREHFKYGSTGGERESGLAVLGVPGHATHLREASAW